MDLLVALVLAGELVLAGGLVATVPAASQFNSVPRTCEVYLAQLAVVFALQVYDALRAELPREADEKKVVAPLWVSRPSLIPWVTEPGDPFSRSYKWTFAICVLQYIYALTLLKFFADESGPSTWRWYANTPCGASSCSSQTSAAVVYNAGGFFTFGMWQYPDFEPTMGVYTQCLWEGSNGLPPISYPPQQNNTGYPDLTQTPCTPTQAPTCIITTRPQDWPNGGFGDVGGNFPGFATPPTRLGPCPGVIFDPVQGYIGLNTCSRCLSYFAQNYNYLQQHPELAYCPVATGASTANDVIWCGWLVPRPYEVRTPDSQQQQLKYGVLFPTTLLLFVYLLKLIHALRVANLLRARRRGSYSIQVMQSQQESWRRLL